MRFCEKFQLEEIFDAKNRVSPLSVVEIDQMQFQSQKKKIKPTET